MNKGKTTTTTTSHRGKSSGTSTSAKGTTKGTATKGGTAAAGGGARGYWSQPEEQALKRAVRKHGIGAWEKMRNDPEFAALRCVRERERGGRERERREEGARATGARAEADATEGGRGTRGEMRIGFECD